MRRIVPRLTAVAVFTFLVSQPHAFAVSKEIVQLQTQVQQLQDMLQHLQTSNASQLGVIVNLVQQNTDSVNKMTALVNSLATTMRQESEASGSRNTQLSTQIQGLNDSIDELKSKVANLTTQVQSIQSQLQNVNAAPGQPAGSAAQPDAGPASTPLPGSGYPSTIPGAPPEPQATAAPLAPPINQLYQGGLRDYNSAKYSIAASEFNDVIRYYPLDPLAGNAQFYLGEIAYRQAKYQDAVKHYDEVLERYSGNTKAPAAELRKGESLLKLGQKDAGVRELRSLVQRYPQTPEAQEGRSRLNGMGVRINPPKPSAYQR